MVSVSCTVGHPKDSALLTHKNWEWIYDPKVFRNSYITLIAAFLVLGATGIDGGITITLNDFQSAFGKLLFIAVILFLVAPVIFNTLSMLWHMLRNKRWWWASGTIHFVSAAAIPYYFIVYRKTERA